MGDSDYQRVASAIRFVEEHALEQPDLGEVAAHLGLSEFHVHRLFHRWAGITPKDFLQVLTLARARRLLAQSRTVLDVSLAVGLSGPARLHDLFVGLEAMTPGEFKAGASGLTVRWGVFPTPLGDALFSATDRGLCGLAFLDREDADRAPETAVRERWPAATVRQDRAHLAPYADEVAARMAGAPGRPLALALRGSPFQVQVWQGLMRIPEGGVSTYGDLAAAIGVPRASRAVGAAVGANPIAYLIPCHRVIRSTGAVGDYRWGSARKTALLAMECARQRVAEVRA